MELPQAFQQFDYNTISDVILQIRYTARPSGGLLKQQAVTELQNALNAIALDENQKRLARLVSLHHEYPSEWYRFLHPAGATDTQSLTIALTPERFPFLSQGAHHARQVRGLCPGRERLRRNVQSRHAHLRPRLRHERLHAHYGSFER
jgi:hypothetical protein